MTQPNSNHPQDGRSSNQSEGDHADEQQCSQAPAPNASILPYQLITPPYMFPIRHRAPVELVEQRLRALGDDINLHSQRRLAFECGVTLGSLVRALRALEAAGRLRIYHSCGEGTDQYEWLVPARGHNIWAPVSNAAAGPAPARCSTCLAQEEARNEALIRYVTSRLRALGDRFGQLGLYHLSTETSIPTRKMMRALGMMEGRGIIRVVRTSQRNCYSWAAPLQAEEAGVAPEPNGLGFMKVPWERPRSQGNVITLFP